jgi:hypothetical protein
MIATGPPLSVDQLHFSQPFDKQGLRVGTG